MSSSRPQSATRHTSASSLKRAAKFTDVQLDLGLSAVTAGTINDCAMVRAVIVDAMRKCAKSRATIADEMTHLTGSKVTERMLNAYAAESQEDARFPLELQRAFCCAVGDNRLLTCGAEAAGLHIVDDIGNDLLELGRQYLTRKRSEAELAELERRLEGTEI